MTLADLHNIPKFAELFADPRFVALLAYQREHVSKSPMDGYTNGEALIFRGGYREGWFDALNDMQERVHPPKLAVEPKPEHLYARRP